VRRKLEEDVKASLGDAWPLVAEWAQVVPGTDRVPTYLVLKVPGLWLVRGEYHLDLATQAWRPVDQLRSDWMRGKTVWAGTGGKARWAVYQHEGRRDDWLWVADLEEALALAREMAAGDA
jgi:hypothetical protein